eukprot:GFUD01117753.1.p1 GENE.GFUD01117753.1~~GFUD01117753.1.p1  ORF type:complete len:234 (+),score=49.80 GFUD01117753.1:48-704(+)
MPKTKRYNGKESNVAQNLFFEQYMESVAKNKSNILEYLPVGYVSRSKASREFGLREEDFEKERVRETAVVVTVKGQTGIFFKEDVIKAVHEQKNLTKVPKEMIDEQTILRSFKKKDIPAGFPEQFRQYAWYGQQVGRLGRPTYFYAEDILEDELGVKLIRPGEEIVPAKSVPFEVAASPFFGLVVHGGRLFTKMEMFYFGNVAKMLNSRLRQMGQGST